MPHDAIVSRRRFTATVASGLAACLLPESLADETPPRRPALPGGVASGDVTADAAIVWSRCDRPARMIVEWSTTESFQNSRRVVGPAALEHTDFTARTDLRNLPAGETIFYRVQFQDLASPKTFSAPVAGRLRTAPRDRKDILFAWSGDCCGQGYGINPDWGGLKSFATMRKLQPHFFLHSGDTIYADNPIAETVRLRDGSAVLMPDGKTPWKNLTAPAKAKVAETLAEFHGNHAYNLLDANLRAFNAEVPSLVQWDDHEVRNNWFPGRMLDDDDRYTVKSCSLLAARARQAFFDYTPMRPQPHDAERIYRSFSYGPLLDVFLLDQRSYRGPNTGNRQEKPGSETPFLGADQLNWLKEQLQASKATWKVIGSDMPLGLILGDAVDGRQAFEGWANGDDGPPRGRELELADLLRSLKTRNVRNVVWLTADVHYAAAHYYDPEKAQFRDFLPFWEFVAGPLNAGTYGPGALDDTFGPEAKFVSVPRGMPQGRPPSDGLQFFGTVGIDARSGTMTVALYNVEGKKLYTVDLPPA